MAIAVLDKEKHKNIKINSSEHFPFAANDNLASVTIKELSIMSLNYPIFIVKAQASNSFRCVAMLGLKSGENLFFDNEKWLSTHIPLILQTQPFSFGRDEDDPDGKKVVTCINEDSPLVSEKEGNALYLDDGTPSNFLANQETLMAELFDGEVRTVQFIDKLIELDLIEECNITLGFSDKRNNAITGLNMINFDKLQNLDDKVYLELKTLGYLPAIYALINSVGNIHLMAKYHNEKSDDKIVQFQVNLAKED